MRLDMVNAINAILPQTQCKQCGFNGCLPYAESVAAGSADINQCPPGGDNVIHELATLLDKPYTPLNPKFGKVKSRARAFIDEARCIGCTLCIRACPVDAIVGATKLMHTVIATHCTGCELCVVPCPVDCIAMTPLNEPFTRADQKREAEHALARFHARQQRLQRERNRASDQTDAMLDRERKQKTINRALERARMRLRHRDEKR
jgi:Na+-translocating ferredoxin:NAD+ oxidoreductase subunit B